MTTDKAAIGVVFAIVGMAACLAIYAIQHAMLVYGPAIRAWVMAYGPITLAIAAYGALVLVAIWGLSEQER